MVFEKLVAQTVFPFHLFVAGGAQGGYDDYQYQSGYYGTQGGYSNQGSYGNQSSYGNQGGYGNQGFSGYTSGNQSQSRTQGNMSQYPYSYQNF